MADIRDRPAKRRRERVFLLPGPMAFVAIPGSFPGPAWEESIRDEGEEGQEGERARDPRLR